MAGHGWPWMELSMLLNLTTESQLQWYNTAVGSTLINIITHHIELRVKTLIVSFKVISFLIQFNQHMYAQLL